MIVFIVLKYVCTSLMIDKCNTEAIVSMYNDHTFF